jgi:UDP-N-acetylmuramoyl-tripeptide--D-alanyl-D-alanine ligase
MRARGIVVVDARRTEFTVGHDLYVLSMPGRHFVYCALPAIYLARRFGCTPAQTAEALLELKPDPLRGRIEKKKEITFIVDCYNANPSSMRTGISLLIDVARTQRRCAVVGDMRELGTHTGRLHRMLGAQLAHAGVAPVIAVGEYAPLVAEGALGAGMRTADVYCAPDPATAVEIGRTALRAGDVVLLKASRLVKLETFFEQF